MNICLAVWIWYSPAYEHSIKYRQLQDSLERKESNKHIAVLQQEKQLQKFKLRKQLDEIDKQALICNSHHCSILVTDTFHCLTNILPAKDQKQGITFPKNSLTYADRDMSILMIIPLPLVELI
jgi:hypothetical protein